MQRLRVVGVVGVERVAVVEAVRLTGLLVLGVVPASGELGLQSLRRRRENTVKGRRRGLSPPSRRRDTWQLQTGRDSPRLSSGDR